MLGIDRSRWRLHREAAVDTSSKSGRAAVSLGYSGDPGKVTLHGGLQPHHRLAPASQLPGSSPVAAMGEAANGDSDERELSVVRQSAACAVMQLGTAALLIALLTIACIQVYSQVPSHRRRCTALHTILPSSAIYSFDRGAKSVWLSGIALQQSESTVISLHGGLGCRDQGMLHHFISI